MSERSYDMLTKMIQAVAGRSEGKLQEIISGFQKKKASGALPTEFPTKDEKDRMHQITTEV